MVSYTKKKNHRKGILIGIMAFVLAVIAAGTSYLLTQEDVDDTPVSTKDVAIPVISLPAAEEKAKRPYQVEGTIVLD